MTRYPSRYQAFSLVELLVSLAVISLLLVMSVYFISQSGRAWQTVRANVEQGREARHAGETIARRLKAATLGNYFGHEFGPAPANSGTIYVPTVSGRRSELRFISGPAERLVDAQDYPSHAIFFTAPFGYTEAPGYARLSGLLNILGYYIEWSNVDPDRPSILPSPGSYRFRLMQFIQPAERMTLYSGTCTSSPEFKFRASPDWQKNALTDSVNAARPIATNVIAMVILPQLTSHVHVQNMRPSDFLPGFVYDSESSNPNPLLSHRNRLPSQVVVILYSIDEASANKLEQGSTMPNLYESSNSVPLFVDPDKLHTSDLADFENGLKQRGIKFWQHRTVVDLIPQPWSAQY